MLRLFKSKVFIIILVTLICFVLIGVTSSKYSKANVIGNALSVPLAPVQAFFTYLGQRIEDGFFYFSDIQAVKQENEQLKTKVADLEQQNKELLSYRDKITEFREALKLKEQFADYELVGGNVIAKDAGNWFQTFRIDIGNKDGIDVSNGLEYPVLSATKGLIGRIMSTDATSSKVVSIIDEGSAVSGWISKPGGGNVRVRGDLSLKEKGLCRMDYIPVGVDVEVNDIIETSGLGGIYPKGIIIGKVVEVKKTSSELDRYAIIQPAVDFTRLEEVYVLRNKSGNSGGAAK